MASESHSMSVAKLATVLAVLALLVAAAAVTVTIVLNHRENVNGQRITEGEVRLCERLNVVRHQSNLGHWVQWLTLEQSVTRSRKLADAEPSSRAIRLKGAEESEALAVKLTWTQLTDCTQAVGNPKGYHAPAPQPFSSGDRVQPPDDSAH
jgi:hypothetical protein